MRRIRDRWRRLSHSAKLRLLVIPPLFVSGLLSLLLGIAKTRDIEGFWLNLGTELLGASITFVLLDLVIGRGEKLEEKMRGREESKERLLRDLRSQEPSIVTRALEELRALGWLEDGSLRWANLSHANLEGARLLGVELPRAKLRMMNLQDANLQLANLAEADLRGSILKRADLTDANLIETDLSEANMQNSNLAYANLKGAYLQQADLQGASLHRVYLHAADLRQCNLRSAEGLQTMQLAQARYLRGATLPDGNRYDGRFRLEGDIELAHKEGLDIFDDQNMAEFYGIPFEAYEKGQEWAREYLQELAQYMASDLEKAEETRIPFEVEAPWSVAHYTEHHIWILSARRDFRIDSSTAVGYHRILSAILEQPRASIIVNLRHISYMSSAGLKVTIEALKEALRSERVLCLCAPSSKLREVLDLSGIAPLFRIYDSLDEAVEAIRSINEETERQTRERVWEMLEEEDSL